MAHNRPSRMKLNKEELGRILLVCQEFYLFFLIYFIFYLFNVDIKTEYIFPIYQKK